jgi:hypothetical protein
MDTIKTTIPRCGSDQESRRIWRSLTAEQRAMYRPVTTPAVAPSAQVVARILRDHIGRTETYATIGARAGLDDLAARADLIGEEIAAAVRPPPFPTSASECTHDEFEWPMACSPGCGMS